MCAISTKITIGGRKHDAVAESWGRGEDGHRVIDAVSPEESKVPESDGVDICSAGKNAVNAADSDGHSLLGIINHKEK